METAINNFFVNFTSILYEAMPFIVLGAIIAGVLEEMLPQSLVARLLPRSRFLAIAIGGLLGLLFPMCECGIVPVMRRLLRKGLPLSCCTAYLLAGPIINVVVIGSTWMAFRPPEQPYVLNEGKLAALRTGGVPETTLTKLASLKNKPFKNKAKFEAELGKTLDTDEQERYQSQVVKQTEPAESKLPQFAGQLTSLWMVILRVGLGYLIAVTTSLIVDWQYRKYGNDLLTPLTRPTAQDDQAGAVAKGNFWQRLNNVTETALSDFVDITAFLVLGSLLAASVHLFISREAMVEFSRHNIVPAILIMMALAILLCLCSEADAFFAASFASLAPAAKVAFLVLGPMMDLKLYMLYTRVFRPRLIVTIFGSVMILTFLCSLAVHYAWTAHLGSP